MIPTFHASSSVTLEVAIPAGRINNGGSGDGAGRTSLQGDSHQIKEEGEDSLQVQVGGDSRNASDLESEGTVNGWSISEAQSTEGSLLWEPCRYYEVGNIRDGVQQVLSNDTLAGENVGVIFERSRWVVSALPVENIIFVAWEDTCIPLDGPSTASRFLCSYLII